MGGAEPTDTRLCRGVPIAVAGHTHTGHVRANNEDAWGRAWLSDGSLLAVVCDGMGGHQAGEVASGIAVQTLTTRLTSQVVEVPQQALYDAIMEANESIIEQARADGRKGMGTTTITAIVQGHEVYVGLVGDSRAYHLRGGEVVTRTRDHTRVEARLQRGEISEAQVRDHPETGILTRALGHRKMANREPLEPEILASPWVLAPGDALVLSSDGLHDLVEDWEIASMVRDADPSDAAARLVDLALSRGGHDNVTVLVVASQDEGTGFEAPAMSSDAPRSSDAPDDRRLILSLAVVGAVLLLAAAIMMLVLGLSA